MAARAFPVKAGRAFRCSICLLACSACHVPVPNGEHESPAQPRAARPPALTGCRSGQTAGEAAAHACRAGADPSAACSRLPRAGTPRSIPSGAQGPASAPATGAAGRRAQGLRTAARGHRARALPRKLVARSFVARSLFAWKRHSKRGECSAPADGAARGWRPAPSIYTEGPTFSFFSFFCNRQS